MTTTSQPEPEAAAAGSATPPSSETDRDEMERPRRLRPLLWRLHFFGGFLAAPVAIWLSITGIIFAWNPQIESTIHGDKLATSSEGEPLPLSEQVDAALEAYPGHELVDVTPASEPGETTGIQLVPPGAEGPEFGVPPGQFTAYFDPVTTEVTGEIVEEDRPDEWIRNLHSNFRLGEGRLTDGGAANTITELSASWVLVSLITGIYLWWPKTVQGLKRSLVPRVRGLRSGRRKPWRDLHSTVGILVLVLLAGMVATGLTWSEYAGDRVDTFKSTLNSESPMLGTSLGGPEGEGEGGAHAEHEEEGAELLDTEALDQVNVAAEATDLDTPYTITPGGPGEAWTAAEQDSRWPLRQAQVAIDPGTGQVVDRMEFGDKSLLDQLTSLGISFHDGSLFGIANQLLLTALALGVILLVVTGYMTWWRRRPKGAFGAPPKPGPLLRSAPIPLLVGFLVIMWLLPTLGVSFLIYLIIERVVWLVRGRKEPGNEPKPATPTPA